MNGHDVGGRVRKVVIGLVLALGAGCASTAHAAGECPDWTRGKPPAAYPVDRYLVGVGVVPGVYDAARGEGRGRDAAQTDIARQLVSRVESENDFIEHGTRHSSSILITVRDRITTSLVGPGARAVDRCWDWKTTTFYLLAVLDRKEAAARVKADVDAANKKGEGELGAAEAALDGDPLAAIAPMGRALGAADTVDAQSAVLRALAAAAPPPFASGARLAEVAQRIKAKTRVQLVIDDPDLRSKISDRLTSAHLESTTVPAQATIRITATVETLRLERSATLGQFVARVRASVQLIRADSGAVIGSTAREGTNGGPSGEVARRRAVADAAKELMPAVDSLIAPLSILAPPVAGAASASSDGSAARPL